MILRYIIRIFHADSCLFWRNSLSSVRKSEPGTAPIYGTSDLKHKNNPGTVQEQDASP
jgi:hypothetical protein